MRQEPQAASREEWREQAECRRKPAGQAVSREERRDRAEYRKKPGAGASREERPEPGEYLVRQEGQAARPGEYRGRAVCLERRREDLGNASRKAA